MPDTDLVLHSNGTQRFSGEALQSAIDAAVANIPSDKGAALVFVKTEAGPQFAVGFRMGGGWSFSGTLLKRPGASWKDVDAMAVVAKAF